MRATIVRNLTSLPNIGGIVASRGAENRRLGAIGQ